MPFMMAPTNHLFSHIRQVLDNKVANKDDNGKLVVVSYPIHKH